MSNQIATDTSWEVAQKVRADREKREQTPKVKADAERPAKFDAYPVRQSSVVWL